MGGTFVYRTCLFCGPCPLSFLFFFFPFVCLVVAGQDSQTNRCPLICHDPRLSQVLGGAGLGVGRIAAVTVLTSPAGHEPER